jgi:hypothetical protein
VPAAVILEGPGHPVGVDGEVLGQDERRLVGPVLEQHPVGMLQPGEKVDVPASDPTPHDELLGAGDDGGRVELEATEAPHEERDTGGVALGAGPGEELGVDGQTPGLADREVRRRSHRAGL